MRILPKLLVVLIGLPLFSCSDPKPADSTSVVGESEQAQTDTQATASPKHISSPAVKAVDQNQGFSITSSRPDKLDEYVRFTIDENEHHAAAFKYAIDSIGKLCDNINSSYQVLVDEIPMDIHKVYCDDGNVYQVSSYAGNPFVKKWTDNESLIKTIKTIQEYQSN